MKTYTEAEVLQAIEYACQYQKATDYQTAGNLLIVDDADLKDNSIILLDQLSSEDIAHKEINLADIFN